MASEILAIPEEHLEDVVQVIRLGLIEANVDDEVWERLTEWCDGMEGYLERLKEEDDD